MVAANKKHIRRRFSNAAARYSALADIQTGIAGELATRVDVAGDARVLDVGAGDGVVAKMLAGRGADVVAIDGAWGMVVQGRAHAPQTVWLQADAGALPFVSGKFDRVVSSSAYQWVDDLPVAFSEVRRVLKPGGRFTAAMFGFGTLRELFGSMEKAASSTGRTLPALRRLPSAKQVRQALHTAGFKDPVVTLEKRVVLFAAVKAILVWLKGIGANGAAKNFFWGKGLLAMTEQQYRLDFAQDDKIQASFEVIWIEARIS